jgi:transcription antitermination factor NusG
MCGKSKQQLTTTATAAAVKAAFKVGDKVRVARKVAAKEAGWDNSWVSSMNDAVNDGREYTVKGVDSRSGIYFKERDYGWPASALELVVEQPVPQEAPKAPKRATAVATEDGVTLHLTMAEAETLNRVLYRISGSEKNSPRKYAERVIVALGAAGVRYDPAHYALKEPTPHTLTFLDYPPKAPKVPPKAPEVKPVEAVKSVATKFQVGDRVKVVDAAPYATLKAGDTGTIVLERKGSAGDWEFNVAVDEHRPGMIGTYGLSSKNLELVSQEPRKARVGDIVEFLREYAGAYPKGYQFVVTDTVHGGATLIGRSATGCQINVTRSNTSVYKVAA